MPTTRNNRIELTQVAIHDGPEIILKGWGTREFRISQRNWANAVDLAKACNRIWTPKGTLPPANWDGGSWNRVYKKPYGQRVEQQDAYDLAEALEFSLDDIPMTMSEDGPIDEPWIHFVGKEGKALVASLAKFCRASQGFRIVELDEDGNLPSDS